ncbi:MAG: hypothetical protein A2474_06085 [Elusimicrobia bacterium RIFOXYC2_FULL_34_12]|nr:MAG: hypothetical protein A2474_06085 [Elusimicrobia bacterium RIFOXYC2_FULL_34_12]OGS38184.1 MAG: hypothetical protein A2551_05330 [Elusimicrobia bacterium RIFOXYD2_FULL_34_30]HAM39296.1 hypothetical protein [Elusimicrobiota bacterium]
MIALNDRRRISLSALITKKRMQLKYFWIAIFAVATIMIIVILSIYITFLFGIEHMINEMYDISKIKPVLIQINYTLLIELIVFIFFAGWLSLRLSHRIAGPLYRIEKSLIEIMEGKNIDEIKIRKYDELHDLVDILNEFLKSKMSNK